MKGVEGEKVVGEKTPKQYLCELWSCFTWKWSTASLFNLEIQNLNEQFSYEGFVSRHAHNMA